MRTVQAYIDAVDIALKVAGQLHEEWELGFLKALECKGLRLAKHPVLNPLYPKGWPYVAPRPRDDAVINWPHHAVIRWINESP